MASKTSRLEIRIAPEKKSQIKAAVKNKLYKSLSDFVDRALANELRRLQRKE